MYNAIIKDKLISEFGLEATIKYAKIEAFKNAYLAEINEDNQLKTWQYMAEWWKNEAKYMEKQLNDRHNEHQGTIPKELPEA